MTIFKVPREIFPKMNKTLNLPPDTDNLMGKTNSCINFLGGTGGRGEVGCHELRASPAFPPFNLHSYPMRLMPFYKAESGLREVK